MNPHARKYHTLVVHYGSSSPTNRCVQSLIQCHNGPDSIIVINNGPAQLRGDFLRPVSIVRSPINLGYAGGLNFGLGILASRLINVDDIIICMNNDVAVASDTFNELRRWWGTHPSSVLLGSVSHVNLLTGRAAAASPHWPFSLNYIDGAFFSAPYHVFQRVRGVPEHYFMYWEDVGLSSLVKQKQIPLRSAPDVKVKHRPVQSVALNHRLYYLVRNGALFLEGHTPLPWRLYWWLANRLRYLWHYARHGRQSPVTQALADAIRHVTGPLTAR